MGQIPDEEVLFFTARADQTNTENGGTSIWSLEQNNRRWWFQGVEQVNVSPDGRRAVYIVNNILHITDIEGNQPKSIRAGAVHPVWSPRGDKIAYIDVSNSQLVIINPDNEILQTIDGVPNWGRPSWSPDGSKIAYEAAIEVNHVGCELFAGLCPDPRTLLTIYSVTLSNGQKTPLYTPTYRSFRGTGPTIITELVEVFDPEWSPNGDRIAVRGHIGRIHTYPANGIPDTWVDVQRSLGFIPANGGAYNPIVVSDKPVPYTASIYDFFPGAWSPDGESLAYVKIRLGAGLPVEEQGTYITSDNGPGTKINGFLGKSYNFNGSLQWVVLNQAGARLEILLDEPSVGVGETVQATLKVTALNPGPMTITFKPPLLSVDDPELLDIEAVDLPAPFVIDNQDFVKTFTVTLDTKKSGTALLSSTIDIQNPDTSMQTVTAERELEITIKGDLLLKRDDEPVEAFALNDVYQKSPLFQQRRTEFIRSTDTLLYQVKIENDAELATTFWLHADDNQATDWTSTYTYNGTDISTEAKSPAGWETPELAPGASIQVTVEIIPPGAPEENEAEILIHLTGESDDLIAVDSVAIIPTTRDVIVVNVLGRDKDADPEDGVLDVDLEKEGAQVSFGAAIVFANERPGKDRIEFDVPGGGIPMFDHGGESSKIVESGQLFGYKSGDLISIVTLTDPVEIDGTTQPGGWVELDGTWTLYGTETRCGITILSGDCTISGLVINKFQGWGLYIKGGGGNWITGNRIGTSSDGETATGNGSPYYRPTSRESGSYFEFKGLSGGVVINSAGNLIQNNVIAGNWRTEGPNQFDPYNVYNTFGRDVWLVGPEAAQNTVIGNNIGFLASGRVPRQAVYGRGLQISEGAHNNQIGDGTAQGHNLIHSIRIEDATGTVLTGNQIGYGSDKETEAFFRGDSFIDNSDNIVIGGRQPGEGNVIGGYLQISDSTGIEVYGNTFGVPPDDDSLVQTTRARVAIQGSSVTLGGPGPGEGNMIEFRESPSIFTDSSVSSPLGQIRYSGNNIYTSDPALFQRESSNQAAILDLGPDGLDINDFSDSDGKPNYPVLTSAILTGSQVKIAGSLSSVPGSAEYSIEFFEVTVPHFLGHGGAMTPIGSTQVTSDLGGFTNFDVTIPVAGLGSHSQVCAIATKVGGYSSEFSLNRRFDSDVFADSDGISDDHEQLFGDRNLDGTEDSQQDRVASFLASNGKPTTLELPQPPSAKYENPTGQITDKRIQAQGDGIFEKVEAGSQASYGAPANYFYSNGVISFEIGNLSANDSTSVKIILADGAAVDTVWILTSEGSWTELDPQGIVGNELAMVLQDGGEGDSDGEANGRIVVVVGAANALPPIPPMEMHIERAASEAILSWPTLPFNLIAEQSMDLSPESWVPIESNLQLKNGRIEFPFLIPQSSTKGIHYFFRLRRPE